MDLKQYDVVNAAETGAQLTLRDPVSGESLDATITLLGSDSEAYRKAQAEEQERIMKRKQSGERVEPSEWREVACNVLAKATIGWKNITEGEKKLECNEKNARYVYRTYPWIREQADEFVGKRANFLANSPSA